MKYRQLFTEKGWDSSEADRYNRLMLEDGDDLDRRFQSVEAATESAVPENAPTIPTRQADTSSRPARE